jgi:MFS family permease
LAVFQISGQLTEWGLFLGALVTGLAFTFSLPVQNAMVSKLVTDRQTKGALAMNSVSYNAGRTLSPILYLFVLASFGAGWAFAINAVTFLVFVATVLRVYPKKTVPQVRPAPGWSGMRMAVRQPRIMLLLAMVAAVTLADDPVQVLGPALARHMALPSPIWPAYFLSALGLGVVLGSIALPRSIQALLRPIETFSRSADRPSLSVETHFAARPLVLLALSVMTFALGWNRWISLTAAVVAGAAALLTGTTAQALMLKTAGPASRTQVMALWAVAWAGTKPIASLADGWLASHYDILRAAVILAAPAILIAIVELCLRPKSRRQLKRFSWKHQKPHRYPQPRPSQKSLALTETN